MRVERRAILGMGLFSLLAGCWKPAQARADSFGSMAEFREHVITILNDRHLAEKLVPDPVDPAKFSMRVHGWEGTVDLTNVFAYMSAYPEENASEIVDRFIASITYDHNQPVDEKDIVAVIRTRDYVDQMDEDVLREPLGADLVILYMADRPDAMAPLSQKRLPGKSLADVRRAALDNIRKWLPHMVSNDELGDGLLYFVEGNTMLSTSLLLLEDFWKSVARRFPGDVLIALPRKDQLFLFDDSATARAGARRLIDATMEENFNLLSPQLYARRGGKIVAVSD